MSKSTKLTKKNVPVNLYDKLMDIINNKNITDSTKKFYSICLNKINSIVGLPKESFDPDVYSNKIDVLTDYFSDSTPTKDNQLKAILMFYKALDLPIPQDLITIRSEQRNQMHSIETNKPKKAINIKDRKELNEVYLTWSRNINDMIKRSIDPRPIITRFLAVCCYCTMPPFRPSEWINLKIVKDNKNRDGNFLNLDTGILTYRDYKTARSWGELHIPCSQELLSALTAFYDYLGEVDGSKYMFTTSKIVGKNIVNEIMSTTYFTQFFKTIDGFNGCTPNDIRNLYCSTIPEETSLEERAKIAAMMKHSVSSQMLIYSKYNNKAYPNQVVDK